MALEINRPEHNFKNEFQGLTLPGVPDEILAAHEIRTAYASHNEKPLYRLVYMTEMIMIVTEGGYVAVDGYVTWHTMN